MVKNPPAMLETRVQSMVGKIPWRRAWQPTPVFLPGEPHGQRSLEAYSPWGRRVGCDWTDLAHTAHKYPLLGLFFPFYFQILMYFYTCIAFTSFQTKTGIKKVSWEHWGYKQCVLVCGCPGRTRWVFYPWYCLVVSVHGDDKKQMTFSCLPLLISHCLFIHMPFNLSHIKKKINLVFWNSFGCTEKL